jgi:hypothetical protein
MAACSFSLFCRATQLLPDVRYSDSEFRTTLTLSPNSEYTTAFKVGRAYLAAVTAQPQQQSMRKG